MLSVTLFRGPNLVGKLKELIFILVTTVKSPYDRGLLRFPNHMNCVGVICHGKHGLRLCPYENSGVT